MLQVGREAQDLDVAPALVLAELGKLDLHEIELDRLVEVIDDVVGGLDRACTLLVVLSSKTPMVWGSMSETRSPR